MKYAHGDSYKEKTSKPRSRYQPSTTIKTPKPSQTKVRIIYPSSGTLELWKFSNLTYGRYLASITPVLSVRSSLFVLHRYCFERVRIVWLIGDFSASSIDTVCGKLRLVSHTITSQTKSYMVLTRSMATTNNVQGHKPRTTVFKRQVQTLSSTIKCLTKQNHALEK